MDHSSAARTNLTSQSVDIHLNKMVGQGHFRIAYAGTFEGGQRNQQEAVCKRFRREFQAMEVEFFASDFKIADRAIEYADKWNKMCEPGKEILITKGHMTRTW